MHANTALLFRALRSTQRRTCATNRFQLSSNYLPQFRRQLTITPTSFKKSDQLPPRPSLPSDEVKHAYLKGSGPGGQKINKTASAVQVTHLPTGLVVKSQATRSRSQNETIARRLLAERIELLEKGAESRIAKKAERKQKKKASAGKKTRRKYRKLEEERRLNEAGDSGVTPMDAGAATAAAIGIGGLSGPQVENMTTADEEWDDSENEAEVEDDDIRVEVVEDEIEADEPVEARVEDVQDGTDVQDNSSESARRTNDISSQQHSER